MAQAWIKHVISAMTPGNTQKSAEAHVVMISIKRAAGEALRQKGLNVSSEQLTSLFNDKQNSDVNNAIIHLKHKSQIIASQTSKIIGLLLREDPQFNKINTEARETIHELMQKQDVFINKTLPLYTLYKTQLADIHNERKNGNFLYTMDIESKIENIQTKIKEDLVDMKDLYTKGQYQTQIVYGLEKLCLDTSKLSVSELKTLSSAELLNL